MIFDKRAVFIHIILFSFVIVNVSSAGTMIDDSGTIMYANDHGEIAKDTWVWIDTDKDSIAECYRFDSDGHIASN